MTFDPEYYRELLRPVFKGRPWLLIGGGPVVAQAPLARELLACGAEPPFLLAGSIGTGTLPEEIEAQWLSLEVDAPDHLAAMKCYEATLDDLPLRARRALDRWDPERRALATGPILLGDVGPVAGRARYARRPTDWAALEDKTALPAFLDAIGIRRGPLAVVAAEPGALRGASARVDRGAGTVWSGDAREGVNGGAMFVRWVRCEESAREAEAFFTARCDRVRVQPFLEGIPCSIHGLVSAEGVAVFRPIETLTFRRPRGGRLVYAGAASYWDPNSRDREAIRDAARRVGCALRELLDYRGVFTLDGVLAEEGFVPTEINPRIGAAFRLLGRGVPGLPLLALALAVQHGEALDLRLPELERGLLDAADASRAGGGGIVVDKPHAETVVRAFVERGDGPGEAREGEAPDGFVSLGPGPSTSTGFSTVQLVPERVLAGPSIAPRVAQGYAFADHELEAGIGPLVPAEPVR
jgi:hypothetical protein